MSKSRRQRKPLRVTIPALDMGIFRGERNVEETNLERRRDKIEDLRLEEDELDQEARTIRKRRLFDQATSDPQQSDDDSLKDKLVDGVVIPIMKDRMIGRGGESDEMKGVVKVLDKAIDKLTDKKDAPKSGVETIKEVFQVFNEVKAFLPDDSKAVEKLGKIEDRLKKMEEGGGKDDEMGTLERALTLSERLRKMMPDSSGGHDERYYEFEKWKVEESRKGRRQDRAFILREKQINQENQRELARLGIESERNDLLRDGFKRAGNAIAQALGEEDFFDEEEEAVAPLREAKLITDKCSVCGEQITIPPESQVAGKEIKCSKCDSTFVWE